MARSWNFRQSNGSLWHDLKRDIVYITIRRNFVDQRWEQWKQRGELGGVSRSGGRDDGGYDTSTNSPHDTGVSSSHCVGFNLFMVTTATLLWSKINVVI